MISSKKKDCGVHVLLQNNVWILSFTWTIFKSNLLENSKEDGGAPTQSETSKVFTEMEISSFCIPPPNVFLNTQHTTQETKK